MPELKPQVRETPIDWVIEYLSARLAEHGGYRREGVIEKIREGLACGMLPMETWVVRWRDGTRTPEEIIRRGDFVSWWPDAEVDILRAWPPELFNDEKVWLQINELWQRWKTLSGNSMSAADLSESLWSAEAELFILCWETKTRSIRREDFVAWYKASPFSRNLSALSESIAVTIEDLWPRADRSKHLQHLLKCEAAERAIEELFPDDLQIG